MQGKNMIFRIDKSKYIQLSTYRDSLIHYSTILMSIIIYKKMVPIASYYKNLYINPCCKLLMHLLYVTQNFSMTRVGVESLVCRLMFAMHIKSLKEVD